MRGLSMIVMACVALGPAEARSKTVDVSTSDAPQPGPTSISKAEAAISADSARLMRVFRGFRADAAGGRMATHRAAVVAADLTGRGFEVQTSLDGTQVVATLRNGSGPTLVYRADGGPDAEAEAVRGSTRGAARPGRSQEPEHGTAFDANLTWMLGMAKAVAGLRADWAGTLVLVSDAEASANDASSRERGSAPGVRVPVADVVVAFSASSAPLGSMLGVRGWRRPGTDSVDVSLHRLGAYEATPHQDSGPALAAAAIRRYGVPDDARFGYVLIGIADPARVRDAPTVFESAPFGEDHAVPLALAAIPLGAKVATVAVLELLARPQPKRRATGVADWALRNH